MDDYNADSNSSITDYNGAVDPGETDPVAGFYIRDLQVHTRARQNLVYLAYDRPEEEKVGHPGNWGEELEYTLDIGTGDYTKIRLSVDKPCIRCVPEEIAVLPNKRFYSVVFHSCRSTMDWFAEDLEVGSADPPQFNISAIFYKAEGEAVNRTYWGFLGGALPTPLELKTPPKDFMSPTRNGP
jgi:hypothetical protein